MTKIKAWTPIIVALIALIGSVWGAYYQAGRSDTYDAAVRALVDQLNETIIPHIQESIADIRERLAVIEAGCCRRTVEAAKDRPPAPRAYGLLKSDMPQMRIDLPAP